MNRLFECSRDDSEQSQYYDLILNPERFTGMFCASIQKSINFFLIYSHKQRQNIGYDGKPIWRAIYEENCFTMKKQQQNNILALINTNNNLGCYEEHFFYRIISGLHTSITIHLTAIHHKFDNHFGPNPKDFFKRFHGIFIIYD